MSTYPPPQARIFSKLNSRLQGAEAHRFDGLRLREGIISSNRSIRNKNTLKWRTPKTIICSWCSADCINAPDFCIIRRSSLGLL